MGGGLDAGGVFLGSEDCQVAAGFQELDGGGDGLGHVVYGAEGDAVELGGEFFGAGGVDFCFEI